jgi:type I restriction enzyme S subunit
MKYFALDKVARIDRTVASDEECKTLPYVGLEHIEKDAGHFAAEFERKPETFLATKFRFTPRHVLYGKLRPYLNKVALPSFDGVCTTEILPILPVEGRLDRTYLWAFLLTPGFVEWASLNVSGANLPRLSPKLLAQYEIPLPSLPEQQRIAAILGRADRLRRLRRTARELSDTYLESTFVHLFGDPGINRKEWDVASVEEILSKDRRGTQTGPFGSSLKRHEYVEEGIPVWGIDNVRENEFVERGSLFITPAKYRELSRYTVEDSDILVSRAGTIGRMCVAHPTQHPSIIGTNLVRVVVDTSAVLPEYFTALFTYFLDRIGNVSSGGTAYSFINPRMLKSLEIPIPPIALQRQFAHIVHKFERLRAQQREAECQAEHLFQALLHRAFRGEV